MSVAYFGTSDFAAAILRRLAISPFCPTLVVSRPDRPAGRGRKISSPPVTLAAQELGLALIAPQDAGEALLPLRGAHIETVCVCAYGQIIREPLLSSFEMLNVHPSLLPRWRGAAPLERAIMAGDSETGVSIMRLSAGLDSGPVCAKETVEIGSGETYGTLAATLQVLGGDALVAALAGSRVYVEQDEEGVTYAEKIGTEDRLLDPALDAVQLERIVRALHPHIGARTPDGLGVLVARPSEYEVAAGQLVAVDGHLHYGCAGGSLELIEVQPAGKRPMDGAAYLRGYVR